MFIFIFIYTHIHLWDVHNQKKIIQGNLRVASRQFRKLFTSTPKIASSTLTFLNWIYPPTYFKIFKSRLVEESSKSSTVVLYCPFNPSPPYWSVSSYSEYKSKECIIILFLFLKNWCISYTIETGPTNFLECELHDVFMKNMNPKVWNDHLIAQLREDVSLLVSKQPLHTFLVPIQQPPATYFLYKNYVFVVPTPLKWS